MSISRGQWAENLAHIFLCEQGLQAVERNFRSKRGEIDLVMLDHDILVFVEVRYRKNNHYKLWQSCHHKWTLLGHGS